MQELDIDGYTVAYLFTFALWVLITLGIFAQRQIFRFRKNNMRREQNFTVGSGLSKSKREQLSKCIGAVRDFQLLRAPKFTEIGTIGEHANSLYISRMIALDELREIDRQLEFINSDLIRLPGESAYAYLIRLQKIALPMLSVSKIERLGYLAEHCRFRSEPFGEKELNELRVLIMDVVRVLNHEQERLSALKIRRQASRSEALATSLPELSKSVFTLEMQKLRRRQSSCHTENVSEIRIDKRSNVVGEQSEVTVPLLGFQK